MKIKIDNILNPEKYAEIITQVDIETKQQLAEELCIELNTPLPDNTWEKLNVIKRRNDLRAEFEEHTLRLTKRDPVAITEWAELDPPKREWFIDKWLPANTVTLFNGQGGTGKSWLTLQIICQVACGFPKAVFLEADFAPQNDSKANCRHVVLATYEDEPDEIKRRLQSLASGMEWIEQSIKSIMEHVHIVDMRGAGSVWGPGLGKHISNMGYLLSAGVELRNICEEQNTKLLVIDPLSGAFGGNENDRAAVYDFISSFRKWSDDVKCAVLAIGHLPKGETAKAAGFSGSTAWEASVRSMWLLSTKTNNEGEVYWTLSHTKSNYAPLQLDKPLIKSKHGWWQIADSVDTAVKGLKAYEAEYNALEQEEGSEHSIENL